MAPVFSLHTNGVSVSGYATCLAAPTPLASGLNGEPKAIDPPTLLTTTLRIFCCFLGCVDDQDGETGL